jgi:acyl-CoA synthetase (AMP-forming)/AMP-acid ligase II/acetyltransferase-like isoleucine patch superfamily enzyme
LLPYYSNTSYPLPFYFFSFVVIVFSDNMNKIKMEESMSSEGIDLSNTSESILKSSEEVTKYHDEEEMTCINRAVYSKKIDELNSDEHHIDLSLLCGPLIQLPPRLVHEQMLKQAELHPLDVALVEETGISPNFGEYQLTFGQVARRSCLISLWLKNRLPPGCSTSHEILKMNNRGTDDYDSKLERNLVAIFMPKCHESILAYYGVLMSGCAYVILDAKLSVSELEQRLVKLPISSIITADGDLCMKLKNATENIGLKINETFGLNLTQESESITNDNHDANFRGVIVGEDSIPAIFFPCDKSTPMKREAFWNEAQMHSAHDCCDFKAGLIHEINTNSLACVGFTSGSTGQPKSVLVPHRMIANENWARQIALPFIGDDECMMLKQQLFSDGFHFGPDDTEYMMWLKSTDVTKVKERYAINLLFHWDVPRALGRGVPVYIIPEAYLCEPNHLIEFLERNKITRMFFSPSLLRSILTFIAQDQAYDHALSNKHYLPDLRILELGLEVTSLSLCEQINTILPHVFLCNEHGSNECGDTTLYIFKAVNELSRCTVSVSNVVPIGQPEANMAIFICDPDTLALLPAGSEGEVFIYGNAMGIGYALSKDADASNAKVFIPMLSDEKCSLAELTVEQQTNLHHLRGLLQDWLSRRCVEWNSDYNDFLQLRLPIYRLGDLGYINSYHQICLQGRTDSRVKVRGINTHMGYTEEALMKHPSISEVLVMPYVNPSTMTVDCLLAYYVRNDIDIEISDEPSFVQGLDMDELRLFLQSDIGAPENQIPRYFICLSTLPRNPISQKYNRKALPTLLDFESFSSGETLMTLGERIERMRYCGRSTHPNLYAVSQDRGAIEQLEEVSLVIAGFAKTLKVHDMELHQDSNFFLKGGTSLLAMQAMKNVQNEFIDLFSRISHQEGQQQYVEVINSDSIVPYISKAFHETISHESQQTILLQDLIQSVKHIPVLTIFEFPTALQLSKAISSTLRLALDKALMTTDISPDFKSLLRDVSNNNDEKKRSQHKISKDSICTQLMYMFIIAICKYLLFVPFFLVLFLWLFLSVILGPLAGIIVSALLWPYLYHGCIICICIIEKLLFVGQLKSDQGASLYFRWRIGRQIHLLMKPSLDYFIGCPGGMTVILCALGTRVQHGCHIDTTNIYDWDLISLSHSSNLLRGATVSAANFNVKGSFELREVQINGTIGPKAHCCPSSETTTIGSYHDHGLTNKVLQDMRQNMIKATGCTSFIAWLGSTFLFNICQSVSFAIGILPFYAYFLGVVIPVEGTITLPVSMPTMWIFVGELFMLPALHLGVLSFLFLCGINNLSPNVMVAETTLLYRALSSIATMICSVNDLSSSQMHGTWHKLLELYLRISMESTTFQMALPAFHLTNMTPIFLRGMGMKLGQKTFVNTPVLDCPHFIEIGDDCVLGGDCMLLTKNCSGTNTDENKMLKIKGGCLLAAGCVVLPETTVGPNTWSGNRSLVTNDVKFRGEADNLTILQGSPAKFLLKRSIDSSDDVEGGKGSFSVSTRILGWVFWYVWSTILIVHTLPLYWLVWFGWQQSWWFLVADLLFTGWLDVLCTTLMLLFYKQCFARTLKPNDSCIFGKWTYLKDELTKLLFIYVGNGLLTCVKGTPFFTLFMKCAGAKVDSSVVWFGNMPPEPDLLQVGPDSVVAPGVDVFTHNMEGWKYTYEPITIGANCTLGERSSMMGFSEMEDNAVLFAMAQVMKGTLCFEGLVYAGNPADIWQENDLECGIGTSSFEMDHTQASNLCSE